MYLKGSHFVILWAYLRFANAEKSYTAGARTGPMDRCSDRLRGASLRILRTSQIFPSSPSACPRSQNSDSVLYPQGRIPDLVSVPSFRSYNSQRQRSKSAD